MTRQWQCNMSCSLEHWTSVAIAIMVRHGLRVIHITWVANYFATQKLNDASRLLLCSAVNCDSGIMNCEQEEDHNACSFADKRLTAMHAALCPAQDRHTCQSGVA